MNPAPGLLSDWITIPGFLWVVLGCIAATYLAIFIVQLVRVWEEDDAANQDAQDDQLAQDVARYHCAAHGCQLRTFYSDEGGTTWVCVNCERSYWVPSGDAPYDQQTDVSEWEREVGA